MNPHPDLLKTADERIGLDEDKIHEFEYISEFETDNDSSDFDEELDDDFLDEDDKLDIVEPDIEWSVRIFIISS